MSHRHFIEAYAKDGPEVNRYGEEKAGGGVGSNSWSAEIEGDEDAEEVPHAVSRTSQSHHLSEKYLYSLPGSLKHA